MDRTAARHSRAEYARRMNRVLDHIDRHLDAPLDLAALAEVAHFSPYHFHRLFAGWMRETLGDYLRRRRLEVGAHLLAQRPAMPVLEVALTVGFGSGEAFARAFKLQFGVTPSAWRSDTPARQAALLARVRQPQDSNPDQASSKRDQAGPDGGGHDAGSCDEMENEMDVKLVELAPVKVAYLRYIGPYGPGIGVFWRETVGPWLRANGLEGRACYGIGLDDPSVTPPEKCRYDACVEIPDGFVPGGAALPATLPGGRYAVTTFRGAPATIGAAWIELCGAWLPGSGLQYDARPSFEYYAPEGRTDPVTGEFSCELCIPVKPL
ncbi:AraC family transcriptional regulator [Chitinimonas koreensis]|uniref:AraC family transcriptional regulator n=1 Tax=Chitinimonas koreensis TaxID=356302 RepID=UPI00048BBAFB|nr:AraC family transcriptional regulator [Chitinimonas koreensis]